MNKTKGFQPQENSRKIFWIQKSNGFLGFKNHGAALKAPKATSVSTADFGKPARKSFLFYDFIFSLYKSPKSLKGAIKDVLIHAVGKPCFKT